MITYNMSVLMGESNSSHTPKIKCNDTGVNLRIFPVIRTPLSKFRDKLEPYQIPPGCTAVLKVAKLDKTYALTDGEIKGDNIFFELPPQACTAIGEAKAEVNMFDEDGRRITTGTFVLEIVKEAVSDHYPDSKVYVDILADYIKAVKTAKNTTETAATEAKEASEAAKGEAAKAEAAQAHAPIIGKNGNWHTWSAATEGYVDSGTKAQGKPGTTPQKGVDYYTSTEKAEMINDVFNALKEMGSLDIVKYMSVSTIQLKPGKIYFFETCDETYKAQICDQNGSLFEGALQGLIMLPQTGYCKYIGIKDNPSSIGLSDLLNFKGLFDKFIQTETFTPTSELRLEADSSFRCWEIAGNSRNLKIGTYAAKELIEGITAELSVAFLYPLQLDEYAIAIDGVEIERQSYGDTIRIAAELLNAKDTQIVFYENGNEVIRATVQPTIPNCGVLYAVER